MAAKSTERRNALNREMAAAKRAAGIGYVTRVHTDDWLARLAEIPPDNRDLTARAFGDPVFERSALALRQAR